MPTVRSISLVLLLSVGVLADQAATSGVADAGPEHDGTARFMVTADTRGASSGVNDTILAEIVQATLGENVDFILIPGDLVYGSFNPEVLEQELLHWRDLMQPVYDASIGVYPCRGNHDAGSKATWDSVFSGPYALPANGPSGEENITFSFSNGGVFVVGLDQYVSIHRVNQDWLDDQFAGNIRPHIFVFGHAPAFKVRHWDCLDDYAVARDTFWNSLAAEGGRVYFCGHDHFYDHARLDDGDGDPDNDLHQLVVGTAGAPLAADGSYNGSNGVWTPVRIQHAAQFGYVLVEVESLQVTATWKRRVSAGVYQAEGDPWVYVSNYGSCCEGLTGNIDRDPNDIVDISDLTLLIGYLFMSFDPPQCPSEANIDGSADGVVDVSDLTALIDYLFITFTPPAPCP